MRRGKRFRKQLRAIDRALAKEPRGADLVEIAERLLRELEVYMAAPEADPKLLRRVEGMIGRMEALAAQDLAGAIERLRRCLRGSELPPVPP